MLDEHYHCIDPATAATMTETVVPADDYGRKQESKDSDLDEEVPMDFDKGKTDTTDDASDDPLEDDKVKELLAGLDDV
jgi:hypothetical protein